MTRRAADEHARTRGARAARDGEDESGDAVDALRDEPEPEWADAIRRGHDDRAAALRSVFAAFDEDDDAEAPIPGAADDAAPRGRSRP